MLQKGFIKRRLRIDDIGLKRFWIAIIAGLLFAISLWMLFLLYRESSRALTIMNGDLMKLPNYDKKLNDYFFATVAFLSGLGITLWIWFGTQRLYSKRLKSRALIRLGQTYVLFYMWALIAIVARIGSLLPIWLYWTFPHNYTDFNVIVALEILFPLVSVTVFLFYWHAFRLEFYVGKWILYSFISIVGLVIIFGNINIINPDIVNNAYHQLYEHEFSYIESELERAEKWNVDFESEALESIKHFESPKAIEQTEAIKESFDRKSIVPLDTLILEKIIIHNLRKSTYMSRFRGDKIWIYALPEQIYYQISLYENPNRPEVQVLFEILREMIIQFKAKEILAKDNKSYDDFSDYEYRLYFQRRNLEYNTKTILSRLVQVTRELKENPKYQQYYDLLPDIDMEIFGKRNRQEYYKLKLEKE